MLCRWIGFFWALCLTGCIKVQLGGHTKGFGVLPHEEDELNRQERLEKEQLARTLRRYRDDFKETLLAFDLDKSKKDAYLKAFWGNQREPREPHLSATEKQAIYDYTFSFYRTWNTMLRNDAVTPPERQRIDALSAALDKLPPFSGVVYRATTKKAYLQGFTSGVVRQLKEFYSTTEDPILTYGFGGYHLLIATTQAPYVGRFSAHPHELEILFPAGSHYLPIKVSDHVVYLLHLKPEI